jgi:hypothetical protein
MLSRGIDVKRGGIWAALLVLMVSVVVMAGCGGSSDSGTTSAGGSAATVAANPDLTKAELIKQGDVICEKTDKAQEAALKVYLKKHPKATSSEKGEAQMVLVAGIPAIQVEAEELAELGAPSGEEEQVQAIVKGIEEATEKGRESPVSLVNGTKNPFLAVDALAAKYGFKVCNNAL